MSKRVIKPSRVTTNNEVSNASSSPGSFQLNPSQELSAVPGATGLTGGGRQY